MRFTRPRYKQNKIKTSPTLRQSEHRPAEGARESIQARLCLHPSVGQGFLDSLLCKTLTPPSHHKLVISKVCDLMVGGQKHQLFMFRCYWNFTTAIYFFN
jgi:hypothetical protein